MDKFFKITERKTTIKREIIAGITVFFSMAYILAVNPSILGTTGMSTTAVFTATAVSAIVGTLIMGLWANFPVAQAPGMGMNAFFAFTLVLGLGYSWQEALFAVFISGLIFLSLAFSGIRERIINIIPKSLKHGVSAGIGFFIAFVGLKEAGIIVGNDSTLVSLGDIHSLNFIIAGIGILIVVILLAKQIKGAIFLALLATLFLNVIANYFMGSLVLPASIIATPPSLTPVFGQLFTIDILSLISTPTFWFMVLSILFIDFFDTAGTLISVGTNAGFVKDDGTLHGAERALIADATATTVGAVIGTSSVTTYVESLVGVQLGGRTGLTAVVVAICFAISLFFSPILIFITPAVTAPALVGVGILMFNNARHIDFNDFAETAAGFAIIIMMILTYSIAEGLSAGFIVYTFAKVARKEGKELDPLIYILTAIFIFRYIFEFFQG